MSFEHLLPPMFYLTIQITTIGYNMSQKSWGKAKPIGIRIFPPPPKKMRDRAFAVTLRKLLHTWWLTSWCIFKMYLANNITIVLLGTVSNYSRLSGFRVAFSISNISEYCVSNYRSYVRKSDCKTCQKTIRTMSDHLQLYNLSERCLCKHRSKKCLTTAKIFPVLTLVVKELWLVLTVC